MIVSTMNMKACSVITRMWKMAHAMPSTKCAMTPSQLFSFRPVPGHADYRTPVRGLYLCGAATHPGGGVTGAPGHNAARAVLADRRRLGL